MTRAMSGSGKRFRAFISYSQRDKAVARRLHRALESYRVPAGVAAGLGPDRRLGRFFRDDEEMGASQSLGAALEGALDDAEALIVLCSPAAARSTWVDAEVRHFKSRGDGRVYAVIAAGEPNAADPALECFCPALKQRIGRDGRPTGERDEPRAPDLRREGLSRVVAQLAAGLLNLPFDDLWQRDRRRARQRMLAWAAAGTATSATLVAVGLGWLGAQGEARLQAADQALAAARAEAADGRVAEAVRRLAPHLASAATRARVEPSLRRLLGWAPDPRTRLAQGGLQPVRLRDATVLLDPDRGVYDLSDVGVELERLIRSRDGARLIAIGDQRVVVFDTRSRERLAQLDNRQVSWIGQAFEAPSGLLVVTGAILGPTNGSVRPFALAVSADGRTLASHAIDAHMFWGSVAGVSAGCDALLVARNVGTDASTWQVTARKLTADGLSAAHDLGAASAGEGDEAGVAMLSRVGPAFPMRDAFMGEASQHLFTSCSELAEQARAAADGLRDLVVLDLGLAREPASRWAAQSVAAAAPPEPFADCTDRRPCPIVGGRSSETAYSREALPIASMDSAGWLAAGRWSTAGEPGARVHVDHRVFNSGHSLALCTRRDGEGVCLVEDAMGEDQAELPLLRSPDGRFLYWPFGGTVFDLVAMRPLTERRAIPLPRTAGFDFEADRHGLTVAVDGRLLSFLPTADGSAWLRQDDERASTRFGVLAQAPEQPGPVGIASLGARHYLVARSDGVLARLDAAQGVELWRTTATGLGPVRGLEVDARRRFGLVVGEQAWRLFSLDDGFPVSGLLQPPGHDDPVDGAACGAAATVGSDGVVTARCGEQAWTWQLHAHDGDLSAAVRDLVCLADVRGSALETIRRCMAS